MTDLVNVALNAEGFMIDPNQWTKELAEILARQEGIDVLTPEHWQIIDFCRTTGLANGKAPTLRQITVGTGISIKDLFALYPKGPAKKVAKIAGLGKPEGCV
ncbi:MAG TPA: sulfur relay protein DsrC [Anaerolineaceae bacterium]|nr:MAG: sulfur relay protein DsrC [Chloroflexi bacterium GWB2_54_36]HAL15836.1 sulfur relay protein DsrC [Anaerolineaceae bacterium]